MANWITEKAATVTITPQAPTSVFSPDGRWLFAGGFDGAVRRWDLQPLLEHLQQLREAKQDDDTVKSKANSKAKPRGKKDGEKAAPEPVIEEFAGHHQGWVEALAAHDSLFASADSWGKLCLWEDMQVGEDDHSLNKRWEVGDAHDGWIRAVAFSPDGEQLVTCGRDQTAHRWSVSAGKRVASWRHTEDLTAAVFDAADGLWLGDARGGVLHWPVGAEEGVPKCDAGKLYKYDRIQDVGGVKALAFDGAGKQLAVGGAEPSRGATVQGVPTLMLFDVESGKLLKQSTLGATKDCYIHGLQWHPDGFWMAVTCGTPGTGQLVFVRSDEDKPFFTDTKVLNPHSLCFNPATNLLCLATTNRGSNGNGRRLNADGEYEGNSTPIDIFSIVPNAATG